MNILPPMPSPARHMLGAWLSLLLVACPTPRVDAPDGGDVASDVDVDDPSDVPGDAADVLCLPDCFSRECGDDGCGGVCGTCASGYACTVAATCVPTGCVPQCGGRECGDDGCGGSCGECTTSELPVCQDGACVSECVPRCAGLECGDDGCGGTCGECEGGARCSSHGHCVPEAWSCAEDAYAAFDVCDCACGAPDPDCAPELDLATLGCAPFEACSDGVCADRVPDVWTCNPFSYGSGTFCNCNCGAPDPDCADGASFVVGCGPGETCDAAGACEDCVPDCSVAVCGDDGCGGSCGECGDDRFGQPLACIAGACVTGCEPAPILCTTNECGADGCGGSCGDCAPLATCVDGACVVPPEASCQGRCGAGPEGGACMCDEACRENGDCCPDYAERCVCEPRCDGRTCGDDGCGGTCGVCETPELPFCGVDGQCKAQCEPLCEGRRCGDDGCGGSCGACGDGESCTPLGACAPAEWACPAIYFADRTVCDCGCGAPDPDCDTIGLTFGCPLGAQCAPSGYCDVSFCASEGACVGPPMCVGHHLTGGVTQLGVCQAAGLGNAPGEPCVADSGCATRLCAAGQCRRHCQASADCQSGEACVHVPLSEPTTNRPMGGVAVCDRSLDYARPCSRRSHCAEGEDCLLALHPQTLAASYFCGAASPGVHGGEGAPCDEATPCAVGFLCAGDTCVAPCPGGQSDCAAGATCTPIIAHPGRSPLPDDDRRVNACVP